MERYSGDLKLPGVSNAARLLIAPLSDEEIKEVRGKVRDIVGGPGAKFDLNQYGQASVKIVSLLELSDDIEHRFRHRLGYKDAQEPVAAALLAQMAYGEWGTLGAPLFSLPLMPPYAEDAKRRITQFIAPADLQRYLCDDEKAVIRTPASCEDKLDYIMELYDGIRHDARGEFLQGGYDERQKVLIRAAVGQLAYMANVEHKADSEGYKEYVADLAKKFGFDEKKFAGFVGNNRMMEWYLDRS